MTGSRELNVRVLECCSGSPPGFGGIGFGSSPNFTDHTMQELCLPSERGMGTSIGRDESRLVSADFGEKLTDEEVDETTREVGVGGYGQVDAAEFVGTMVGMSSRTERQAHCSWR